MANIRATKNGVWSDATVWSPNAPTSTDDVFPAGFTVYIDQNITASSISTVGATGIGGGGVFRPNNGVVMTTNAIAGSSTCVNFASASPNSFTLIGNVSGSVNTAGFIGINNTSTGTVNIVGTIEHGTNAAGNGYGVLNTSTGIVNITGVCSGLRSGVLISGQAVFNNSTGSINVYGYAVGGLGGSSVGIYNAGGGSVTIYGTVSGYSGTNSFGAYNASTGTIRVIGNVYGGQGTSTPGIVNISTGTIEVTGNVYGLDFTKIDLTLPIGGSGSYGIHGSGNGPITVTGNVYSSNMRGDAWGIYNQNGATVTVIGNVYGGTGPLLGTSSAAYGINNNNTNSVTVISGSAIGGSAATAYGVYGNAGIVRVKRAVGNDWGLNSTNINGSTPGIFGALGSQTFVEELQCGARGQWPTGGNVYFTPNAKATSMFKTSTFQNITLIESNSADNLLPPVSSVRQGTTYNLGLSTGTCVIPAVSTVAIGVLVDNTVGTAVLTPANTWNYNTSLATDVNSLGGRLKDIATIQSVGQQLTAFNL